jgi:hypothetical protein
MWNACSFRSETPRSRTLAAGMRDVSNRNGNASIASGNARGVPWRAVIECGGMANPEHVAKLREGVEAWNAWREEHPQIQPALMEAALSKADLLGVNLKKADLYNATLRGADLREANLYGANLHNADLIEVDLRGANLGEAVLSKAAIGWNVFADLDLSDVKRLETVRHAGPSTIGIDTFYRSQGNIPDAFLRGAGAPNVFITYAASLIGQAFQFYSCFISYSTRDQDFADRLYADLQAKGVRCWFAPRDMKSGRKIHEQIDEAIRLYDRLLLILSPASIESEWVNPEIAKARKREVRDRCRVLFPIRLVSFETLRDWECFDADAGKDSAREIREYYIPDFSSWKTDHDVYQRELARLIASLNARAGRRPRLSGRNARAVVSPGVSCAGVGCGHGESGPCREAEGKR